MTTAPPYDVRDAAAPACPACGTPSAGGRFCAGCGAPLVQVPAQAQPEDELVLPWSGEESAPSPVRPASWRRPRVLVPAALLTCAVGAGGVLGAGWYAERDVRSALDSSSRAFSAVVQDLAAAESVDDVADAASRADAAAERVGSAASRLSGQDPLRDATRAQLDAERAVLVALAELEPLAAMPLETWGSVHTELATAVAAEAETRDRLLALRESAAEDLPDLARMLPRLDAAAGPALAEDAVSEAERVLRALERAEGTGDVRALADSTAGEDAALVGAAEALPEGDGRDALLGWSRASAAVASLAALSGEQPAAWKAARPELSEAVGLLGQAAGDPGLKVAATRALTHVDEVVQRATTSIEQWKRATAAAQKDKTSDLAALEEYSELFRTSAQQYEQLRTDLGSYLERSEDPENGVTYGEDYATLEDAMSGRRLVRDDLVALTVPASVREAHDDVVGAIDRSINAVQAAYDGLVQSQDCYYTEYCTYYAETPGWTRFLEESRQVGKDYTAAFQRWEDDSAAAAASIENRSLPARPDV